MDIVINIYKILLVLYYIFSVWLIIYLYFKYSKPYPSNNLKKYSKEIPSKLNPIELSILVNHKITPQVLTATICYLTVIGALQKRKEKNDIYLYRNSKFKGKLSHSQKYAIEFMIDIIGNRSKVSFSQIKNCCNKRRGSSSFLLNYELWKKMALKESSKKEFFEQKKCYSLVKWHRNLGLFLAVLNLLLGLNYFLGYFILIPAFFSMFYFSNIYKRTKKYNDEFYKWLEFGNYLKDIKTLGFEKDNINAYLVYATVLNKIEYVEPYILNSNDFTVLNESIIKCYKKAYFHGSRNL